MALGILGLGAWGFSAAANAPSGSGGLAATDAADSQTADSSGSSAGATAGSPSSDSGDPVSTYTTSAGITVLAPSSTRDSLALALLDSAVANLEDSGTHVGLYVQDLRTGCVLEHNADELFYPASTIKVAVCTLALQQGSTQSALIQDALVNSSNEAYHALVMEQGRDQLSQWLAEHDAPTAAQGAKGDSYPWLTPQELASVWLAVNDYVATSDPGARELETYLAQTNFSVAGDMLRGRYTVLSKPGWYPADECECSATNDAGIVRTPTGGYVFAIMTDADEDFDALRPLVMGVDLVATHVLAQEGSEAEAAS